MTASTPSYLSFDPLGEVEIPEDGTLSRTLYQDDQIRVVVFGFDEGQELTGHSAARPAIVQVLSGRIRLELAGAPIEIASGAWVRMDAHLTHAVRALEPSVMLLTLLERSDSRSP